MSQSVLVINAGSSSVKFAVIEPQQGIQPISGIAERIGNDNAELSWKLTQNSEQPEKHTLALTAQDTHLEVIQKVVDVLTQAGLISEIAAIGHRVVHGGEKFNASVLIDNAVIEQIEHCSKLAPLHNPANLQGIYATQKAFPSLPQVAVFDTAFHQTLPEKAYIYPIPYTLYQSEGIRRYGFHGTSHSYVANQAAKMLNKSLNDCNLITAHLGNGCSISAVKHGESIDTSMGFTPLAGFTMGTRCGDIDPGLISYLINELNYTAAQVDHVLNKESGLLGISQTSNDLRELIAASEDGNEQATLALNIFTYQIAKTIAAYMVPLQQVDAIVLTGGIGENSYPVREKVIKHLGFLGLQLDEQANLDKRFGESGAITTNTGIQALVIPTNEELVIAQDAFALTR